MHWNKDRRAVPWYEQARRLHDNANFLIGSAGASPGEGTGATMSDDEDNQVDSEANMFDGNEGSDGMGFGPLILTEGERSLVERVRRELKNELKQVSWHPPKFFISPFMVDC